MPDRDPASFLARWSRLKRGDPPEPPADPAIEPSERAPTQEPVAEVRPEDLPDIDDLKIDSDVSAFLQKGVPEQLQRLALRKMWSLDPAIRDFIEVAENQYDFNAGLVPGFGELAPGVDMQRLLAQAIGAEPEHAAKEDTPLRQDAAAAAPADTPPSPVATEPTTGVAMQQASGMPESEADQPAPSRRRRHGGALPT